MSVQGGILKSSKSWSIPTLSSDYKLHNGGNIFNPRSKNGFIGANNKEYGTGLNISHFVDVEYQKKTHTINNSQQFPGRSLNIPNKMFFGGNVTIRSENEMLNSIKKPVLRHSSSFCTSSNNRINTNSDIRYIHRSISSQNNSVVNNNAFPMNFNSRKSDNNQNRKIIENSNKDNSFYIPIVKQAIGIPNIHCNNSEITSNSRMSTFPFKSMNNYGKNLLVSNKDKSSLKPLYNQENMADYLNNQLLKRIMAVNVKSSSTGWGGIFNATNTANKILGMQFRKFDMINNESVVSIGDIDIKSILGFGSTSLVYLATWRGTDVAVKIFGNHNNLNQVSKDSHNALNFRDIIKPLEKNEKDSQRYYEFKCELNLLKQVRHPNIVQYMGGNALENPPFLICEFCSGGTLFNLLHGSSTKCSDGSNYIFSGPKIKLSIFQRLKILLDIAKGIYFLHTSNPAIIHRDIKSLNIFLSSPVEKDSDIPIAKIGDFGLCKLLSSTGSHIDRCESLVGTYQWMAPEVIINQVYNEYIDIYSFGMTMYEVLSNKTPFIEMGVEVSPEFLASEIIRGVRPSLNNILNDVPSEIVDMMVSCWDKTPSNRRSMISIIKTLRIYIEKYNKI
ncbi:hypothetical protein FG386_003212 [Cryptosporidium ryanae]|uniref:uncharacterized protein n=1 Tax=Cryptosporidium ryanae TaxID=515981 RepID=UPI00351A938F|nr:hypothetical protein FG386_003212 [Cryptosporidium ryanae]